LLLQGLSGERGGLEFFLQDEIEPLINKSNKKKKHFKDRALFEGVTK